MSSETDSDPRIPVRIGTAESAGSGSYVLLASDLPAALPGSHLPGCACCTPRGPLARALARLFLARVRGEVGYFEEVVLVGPFSPAALAAALTEDVVAAARFRPANPDAGGV